MYKAASSECVYLTAARGGHSGYAKAIAHYLGDEITKYFIIARGDQWTANKIKDYGNIIDMQMPRKLNEPLLFTLHRWPLAFIESLYKIKRRCRVLISCGSNLSIAPAITAWLKRLKIVNVESIVRLSSPGKTPSILRPISDVTLVHWEEQAKLLPGAVVVGPIYEPPRYKTSDEGYILVTTGTHGHRELFDLLTEIGPSNIVLQTGEIDPKPYREKRPEWQVIDFTPDLVRLIAKASIVITHFPGMTSATAALAYRKPVVMVAAPHLKLSASIEDGELYAKKIGAVFIKQLSKRNLREAIERASSLEPRRYENGAKKAAEIIKELIKTSR